MAVSGTLETIRERLRQMVHFTRRWGPRAVMGRIKRQLYVRILLRTPFYLSVKAVLNFRRSGFAFKPDPFRIYWISPEDVTRFTGAESDTHIWSDVAEVRGGDWDLEGKAVESSGVFEMLRQRFEEGRRWQDVDFVASALRGECIWHGLSGAENRDEILERCAALDSLFHRIKTHGFKSKRFLFLRNSDPMSDLRNHKHYPKRIAKLDEIVVDIGRDGEFLLVEGRHRISIAKIIGVSRIPVRVLRRHQYWQIKRERIFNSMERGVLSESLYGEDIHPDLESIKYASLE